MYLNLYYLSVILCLAAYANANFLAVSHNVSLVMPNANRSTINNTCNECICKMMLNESSISSLNCFRHRNACELFFTPLIFGSFSLINNSSSTFYALSLPPYNKTVGSTPNTTNTSELTSFLFRYLYDSSKILFH